MEQLNRIQRAIDFIEEHLKEEISLESIAKKGAYSLWHFQRIFSAIVNDSLKGYLRSRRLSAAATELATTKRRILDIALDYDFESQESFSRAFKKLFGVTPGHCRKSAGAMVLRRAKVKITPEYLRHISGGLSMEAKIVEQPEIKIIGMTTTFIGVLKEAHGVSQILPKLWQQFLKRRGELKAAPDTQSLGVCEPLALEHLNDHPHDSLYCACVRVNSFDHIPTGMVGKILPAGRYAVFTHKGPIENLEHTFRYIYGSWSTNCPYTLRSAPDFELYDQRYDATSADSEVDLYIPIE